MPEIMIATRNGALSVDGRRYTLRRGRTTAHADHPAVRAYPRAWMPIPVNLPTADPADGEETDAGAAEGYAAQLQRLADGLRERGIEAEDETREGWLVDTVLAALDRQAETAAPGDVAEPKPVAEPAGLTKDERAAIRTWAKQAGIELATRGTIPPAVVEQYRAAHGG